MTRPFTDLRTGLGKRTMREQIAEKVRAMIGSGLLREGDQLPSERDLAATLGVSRETIRSAIQALAGLNMVEIAQGARSRVAPRGAWLTEPTTSLVNSYRADEIYGARIVVEIAVTKTAATALRAADLTRLRHLVDAQGAMFADPVAFQISDMEFHATLYESGGNRLLADFLTGVYGYALDLRRRALLMPDAVKRSWLDHRRIVEALERRDATAAAAAMERHLARVHRTTQLAETQAKRESDGTSTAGPKPATDSRSPKNP